MTDKDLEQDKNAPPKITGNGEYSNESPKNKPPTIQLKKNADAAPPKLKLQRPPSERKPAQGTTPSAESEAKHETARISLSEAKPVESGAIPAKPASAPPPKAGASTTEAVKSSTIRIDDLKEESLEEIYKAALNATQRVILDEEAKAKTDQLKSITDEKNAKESTIKLQPNPVQKEQEEDKTSTAKLKSITDQAIKMETARIDDVKDEANQTVSIKSINDADKSETARIEAPPEAAATPPSQRKTIRIKRPDASAGGGPRTMTIARSGGATSAAPGAGRKLSIKQSAPAGDEATDSGDIKLVVSDETPSALMGSLALVATFLAIAVVYVLVATLYEAVPFPGRIVGL
jgi:hypothetical protein